jgi:hypothetical protein
MTEFDTLFCQADKAFKQSRTAKRALELAHGLLNCMGRRTVTGMITANGQQFKDWTAAYRLFQGSRMNVDELFSTVRGELLNGGLAAGRPVYAHMDDTNTRKRGKKTAGTSWMRDPLGPPFHTNFIWGQRFIQLSIALPEKAGASRSRAVPVDFHHCPAVKKPAKTDGAPAWTEYREKQKKAKLSKVGSDRIASLRKNMDMEGAETRPLIVSVDGGYTNETVIKNLPKRTTLIGRIRKDCCLHLLPDSSLKGVGRNRVYGEQVPTPEQIRQSGDYPWIGADAWAAGKKHAFDIKTVKDLRWRKAGDRNLRLVIIRPLGYRLTKKSRMLYRQPAYLICTDPNLNIEELLQAYLWRWEIEVNIRDEKTLLGCGQAQVRKTVPVEKVPAFTVAVYSMLLMAAHKQRSLQTAKDLPRAKWYKRKSNSRESATDMINKFRAQIWTKTTNIDFSRFVNLQRQIRSHRNTLEPTMSAIFYMRN